MDKMDGEQKDEEKYVTIDSYDAYDDKQCTTTIGDRVRLKNDNLEGTVKFIGPVQDKKGVFYGIELNEDNAGENDGSFRDKQYFEIKGKKRGIFIQKQRILKTFTQNNSNKRVTIGDAVYIQKFDCNGTIRFIGTTRFKEGVWYGVELDEPKGKSNGTIQGEWYFSWRINMVHLYKVNPSFH